MPSREEFMRQMGISTDDAKDPQEVKTKFPSRAVPLTSVSSNTVSPARMEAVETAVKKRGYQSYSDELRESSVAPMEHPIAPQQRAATNNSRADFLRSLGIDNMDAPPLASTAGRSPENRDSRGTASQEYVTRASSNRPAAVRSTDSAEDGPGPRSFMAQPAPDITLGMRKAPKATGLNDSNFGSNHSLVDKELEGLSVEDIKAMGNKCFESGEYRKSIRLYTRALERDPQNHALYSNRSACYLQAAKQMGIDTRLMALRDADKVVELRPDWFKGYSRRGDALFKLDRFSEAAVAYERGLALDPANTNLMHSLGEARNAAGGVKQTRSASWSTQAQGAETLRQAQGKSAHVLMEEMRDSLRKQSSDCIAIGNDYREQQLQRYREMPTRATSSMSSSSVYKDEYDEDSTPQAPSAHSARRGSESISLSNVRNDETFGSQAAANYQASILEQYRRKKAAAAAATTRTY
jgi:tetratricopeptide (TPR) repeat protein